MSTGLSVSSSSNSIVNKNGQKSLINLRETEKAYDFYARNNISQGSAVNASTGNASVIGLGPQHDTKNHRSTNRKGSQGNQTSAATVAANVAKRTSQTASATPNHMVSSP